MATPWVRSCAVAVALLCMADGVLAAPSELRMPAALRTELIESASARSTSQQPVPVRHADTSLRAGKEAPFAINVGVSATWTDPAANGQGFVLDVAQSERLIIGVWITHAASPNAERSQHRWLTVVGPYTGSVAETTLYLTRGGGFTIEGQPATIAVGNIRFEFADCSRAVARYSVAANAISGEGEPNSDATLTGSISLRRLTSPSACERTHARDLAFAELGTRLDWMLAESVQRNGIIGTQAAVRIPGFPPWQGVQGRNGTADPMRPEYMIGTGSITKMLAVIAALRLVDRGQISLGDRLGKWFAGRANIDPAITVKQTMQQVSGIADYFGSGALAQAIPTDPQRVWSTDELIGFIGPPLFPAGSGWDASNSNRLLLGRIVELESGKTLAEFMRTELFRDQTSMWLAGFGTAPATLATQWATATDGSLINMNQQLFGPSLFTARGEVHASAGALASFMEDLLLGDLLSAESRQAMLEFIPDDGRIAGQTGGGLGIRRFQLLGRTLYGHSGGTQNSSAFVLFDPITGISAAVSVNQGGPSHRQSHFQTTPALLQAAIETVGNLDTDHR